MAPYSIYLHIPFCTHRCGYCDFNTFAGLESLIPDYVRALCAEITSLAAAAEQRLPVHTIFFGGGTPSLLPAKELEKVLITLKKAFDVLPGAEITLEANPGTLSLDTLRAMRRLGVNRLSLGVQSARPEELRLLERGHSYLDVIQAVAWARQAGFDNLNLDLIFGLPEQALESWRSSLELAVGLQPEHFSLYALTLEHGTPFGHWAARGLLPEPDPDLAADMYDWAAERLGSAGYAQYEISNWAFRSPQDSGFQTRLACRHNLQYWRNLAYLGLGAGAHGYASGLRTANVSSPTAYIQRLLTPVVARQQSGEEAHISEKNVNEGRFPLTQATQSAQRIERQAEMGETMMTGLRLTQEGVPDEVFTERFGKSLQEVYGQQIERLRRLGLLEWAAEDATHLRLTPRGRLLGNQVFMEFID